MYDTFLRTWYNAMYMLAYSFCATEQVEAALSE